MRVLWLALLTGLGACAALPVTLAVSGLARWDERGPDAAHHADSVVLGRVSPWPVDSDEQEIAVGLGLLVAAALLLAALIVHRWLRQRLPGRPATTALAGAAAWCAPTVVFWLSWPPVG